MTRRRDLLRTGALVAGYGGLVATAGCTSPVPDVPDLDGVAPEDEQDTPEDDETASEEPEEPDEPEDDPDRRPQVEIARVRFLDSEPDGFREYNEVEDATYGADAEIGVYIEPADVALEPVNGEQRYEIDVRASVTDPTGEQLRPLRGSASGTVSEDEEPIEVYVYLEHTIREPRVGEYTVDVEVVDQISGARGEETTAFSIEDEQLRLLTEFRERAEEETDGEVKRSSLRDETLGVSFAPVHGTEDRELFDDAAEIALAYAEAVGEGIETDRLRIRLDEVDDDALGRGITVDADSAAAFADGDTDEEAYLQQVYDHHYVIVFQSTVEEETDVDIDRASVRDETLSISYDSPNEVDEEAFEEEIGGVAGAYAGAIEAGLSTDGLRATGEDADGESFSYRIETDTVEALNDGEIDMEELLDEVLESVRGRGRGS